VDDVNILEKLQAVNEEQIVTLTARAQGAEWTVGHLTAQNQTLTAHNQTLKEYNQTLKAKDKDLRAQNQTLKEYNQTLKAKDKDLRAQNQTLTAQNHTLTDDNQTLTADNQTLTAQNSVLERIIRRWITTVYWNDTTDCYHFLPTGHGMGAPIHQGPIAQAEAIGKRRCGSVSCTG
jgi:seryl-tRNA synthetase